MTPSSGNFGGVTMCHHASGCSETTIGLDSASCQIMCEEDSNCIGYWYEYATQRCGNIDHFYEWRPNPLGRITSALKRHTADPSDVCCTSWTVNNPDCFPDENSMRFPFQQGMKFELPTFQWHSGRSHSQCYIEQMKSGYYAGTTFKIRTFFIDLSCERIWIV